MEKITQSRPCVHATYSFRELLSAPFAYPLLPTIRTPSRRYLHNNMNRFRSLFWTCAVASVIQIAWGASQDNVRASIISHGRKWSRKGISHGSGVIATEMAPITAVEVDSAPEVDGATLYWNVGNWSECSADCGEGLKQRVVECVNEETMLVEDDSVCQTDPVTGKSPRPLDTTDCMGPCIKCDDRTDLFRSIGLAAPPVTPVRARTAQVCHVTDPKYSCCDKTVENSMITQVVAIQKGFKTVPETAADQKTIVVAYIASSTAQFQQRLAETQNQFKTVSDMLAVPSNLKGDKKQVRALNVVRDVLEQRIADLKNAIDNSTAIVKAINAQLEVLAADTSLNLSNPTVADPNAIMAKKASLTDCVNATVNLFASMGCAACNPSFVSENIDSYSGIFNSINVTNSMCTQLYKQCSPTVRDSRRYLRSALQIMRSIHSNLARTAARLQPALLALWSEISFDWLPGAASPLSADPAYAGVNTYVPDVTSLDCIKDASVYSLRPAVKMEDFCSNFFDSWNYQFTVNNLVRDVKVGVQAMGALQRCDKCVHTIASKVGEILSNGKGGLDVTLALSKEALAEAGCAGLSSTPATNPAISIKQQLLSGQLNIFAVKEGDMFTQGEKNNLASKSKRAMSLMLKSAPTEAAKTDQALASNFTYIYKLEYEDHGMDPTSWANVSWDVVAGANKNPPPSIWEIRGPNEVGIIATDFNCTSHISCNPESGDAPYWFCANSKVCNGTLPCDDNEKALLKAHPRCVKGLCVDGSTAVDGKCPDIAICPQTKSGQFDHFYFSKFKSVAPVPPPASDLVSEEGPGMASAITRALSYASGVCDCAFRSKIDEKGLTKLEVADSCKYAQCLAYAIANEPQPNCQASLSKQCQALQAMCPNVDCDKVGAQWNVPTCDAGETGAKIPVLASDTLTKASRSLNSIIGSLVVLAITLLIA